MNNLDLSKIGRLIFAIATVGYGILHFVYGDFIMGRAPAWPSEIPGQLPWAYLSGILLVILGIAIAAGKKPRIAAIGIAVMVFFWAFFRHIIAGHWAWGGEITNTFKALNKFAGALAVAGSLPAAAHIFTDKFTRAINRTDSFLHLGRIGLGAFMIISGIQHFMFVDFVSQLIPAWIPGKIYWTYFTGVALIAGGAGLQLNKTLKPAAILSGIMIFTWFLILHIPRAVFELGSGSEWIGVVGSLSTSGIAFVLAESGKSNRKSSLSQFH